MKTKAGKNESRESEEFFRAQFNRVTDSNGTNTLF